MGITTSKSTKITASLFFLWGIITLFTAVLHFTTPATQSDSENIRSIIKGLIHITMILFSGIHMMIGYFLLKGKHWSHTLGFVTVILALCVHLLTLMGTGATRWLGFTLSIAIFISLIIGRKDIKKV